MSSSLLASELSFPDIVKRPLGYLVTVGVALEECASVPRVVLKFKVESLSLAQALYNHTERGARRSLTCIRL